MTSLNCASSPTRALPATIRPSRHCSLSSAGTPIGSTRTPGPHRLHGLASMLLSATGRFSQKTPTERNQIQLLLSFAYPLNACKILHLHLRLHPPKQKASQPEARSTLTCLHRLHCLHGSHDDRCGKRAGARRGVRDPRSGCSNRVNVAPQSRSRLPLTGPILDTQHVRQTTSSTTHGPCLLLTFAHYASARRDRSHKR